MTDVRPLPPSDKQPNPSKSVPGKTRRPGSPPTGERKIRIDASVSGLPNPGFDRRTAQRLREGRMEIDGRLDLHGLTLAQAHVAVISFIERMVASDKRCLLIITGKGERETPKDMPWYEQPRGQIRQVLPAWLADPSLAQFILSTAPARPEHGGSGACYVLLRRRRG